MAQGNIGQVQGIDRQNKGGITATFLQQHFTAVDAGSQTRLRVLTAGLASSTMKQVTTAVRDWSASYKDRPRERSAIQTRGSEVKSIKAAMDAVGFTVDFDQGWQANVNAARRALETANLTNSGRPEVDRDQVAARKARLAIAATALELAGEDVSKMQENMEAAADIVLTEKARGLAVSLFKKYGHAFCIRLADTLPGVADAEQEKLQRAGHDALAPQGADAQDIGDLPEAAAA